MNLSASRWAPAGDEMRNTPPSTVFRNGRASLLIAREPTNGPGNLDNDYDMEDMHLDSGDMDDYDFDTAIDYDGDVVMVDLNDPGIIKMVTELTRNERQAENMREYVDLKPGLRPTVSKSRIPQPSCLLIIDTNFIISHLQLVDNLVRSHHRWKNVVVMPWATIQELDGLKKSSHAQKGLDLGKLARNAINWAFGMFTKLDPGVWGQTKEECKDSYIRGDAAILECCRSVHIPNPEIRLLSLGGASGKSFFEKCVTDSNDLYFKNSHETVLLSNDKNLCIQAMIHNIKTVSIVGEILTAETILTRILGSPINQTEIKATPISSRETPRLNPGYNSVSDYTTYNREDRQASIHHTHLSTSRSVIMQPIYSVASTGRGMNEPCFYQGIGRSQSGDMIGDIAPKRTMVNGLEASIYATTEIPAQGSRCRAEPSSIPGRLLRTSNSFLRPSRNDESKVQVKRNLSSFLQKVSIELVATLVPLLKQCVQSKLAGSTEFTLEALNCHPEEQVRNIIDLERFFHTYWAPVFREYLPADYGHAFKNGDLNRRLSEWIQWTETIGSNATGPKFKEVKKWIDEWDFIWKRIIFTAEETHVNIETADRWRIDLLDVGLVG